MGIVELHRHNLVDPYPVLCDKEKETTVHLKATVLILSKETQVITGIQAIQAYTSEKKLQDKELLQVLASSLKNSKKAKKGKKAKTSDAMDTQE
jgi:hypothetical protein